jgi:hypothetical protein
LKYSPELIGEALSINRLGGICFFSICGSGETMLLKELPVVVYNILKQGHYINITTNGTITSGFEQFKSFPKEYLQRIHFSFSLHYLELLRTDNVRAFFSNIKLIKSLGCSYFTQINLYDGYFPYLNEIKEKCLQEINEIPQLKNTRKYDNTISLYTDSTFDNYINAAHPFISPLFDFSMETYMVKRNEFCYAGDWTLILDLTNGQLKKCYLSKKIVDIFDKPKEPIKFEALGNNCSSQYCLNAIHFLSLGCIPKLETPSYAKLRNRGGYTDLIFNFLNNKLKDSNKEYNSLKKCWVNLKVFTVEFTLRCMSKLVRILNKRKRHLL